MGVGVAVVVHRPDYGKLLATYNRVMANRFGYAVVGRALPATLFGLILSVKALSFRDFLATGAGGRDGLSLWAHYADMAYQALVLAFLAMVCLLFVVRQPVVRGLASLRVGLIAIAGTFGGTLLAFAPPTMPHIAIFFVAVCLMGVGTAIALLALLRLGRCFGMSPQARGLVTSGPYRLMRHPIYVGEEIATLGVLLPVLGPATLAIFAAHCLLQFVRAVSEEAVLEAAFPHYATYKHQVARFLPGIY